MLSRRLFTVTWIKCAWIQRTQVNGCEIVPPASFTPTQTDPGPCISFRRRCQFVAVRTSVSSPLGYPATLTSLSHQLPRHPSPSPLPIRAAGWSFTAAPTLLLSGYALVTAVRFSSRTGCCVVVVVVVVVDIVVVLRVLHVVWISLIIVQCLVFGRIFSC